MFIRKADKKPDGASKKGGSTIASSCSHGMAVGVMNVFLMRAALPRGRRDR
ncbi:hypothetical protein MY7_0400 [Bacillus sp. 5B6]|nr:hypothetical protein MY7_0400 [Bacillus sp. 5B6]